MPVNRLSRPIILGVVGDSAVGKTTLSHGIAEILGKDRVAVICTDDYHKFSRTERAENGISALDPKGNYVDIMEQDLQLLRAGKPILKPIYNHEGGTLDRPEYITSKPYIIVEGLLGFTTRAMRDCFDVKIYLDPSEELRVDWKVNRDTTKRGYTREAVMASLEKRVQDSVNFIQPQRRYADIVISFQKPKNHKDGDNQHLSARHLLRPTLPHPNLTPILEQQRGQAGITLELTRDRHGKPVDVLEIDGNISAEHAAKLQNLLWDLIPEASHLRENVGTIDGQRNREVISHPLCLTQLLIAYHMVKAAVGEYAV